MDTFIVAVIVLAAVIAVVNTFVKTFRSGNASACGCGCSCPGCDVAQSCDESSAKSDRLA
jgi:hypothetical protein